MQLSLFSDITYKTVYSFKRRLRLYFRAWYAWDGTYLGEFEVVEGVSLAKN